MRMEEALYVDDSDLRSLVILRPCTTNSNSNSNSNSNQQHQHEHHISQTLTPRRLIPGPAGKIQSAMMRNRLHDSFSPIPTQDFLYNPAAPHDDDDDDDFKTNAWLHAIHFLQTTADVVLPPTPLSSVVNRRMPDANVNQVVAIINSCTPNGLGDMMVTLKDPTGIIDGTIHRKVLTDSEFAKDISVKAAMILKKVSIFAPSPKTGYLNITRRNVVKVFRKDTGPLLWDTHVAPKLIHLPPDISRESRILEDAYTQKQGRTEETMHEVGQVANAGRSWLINNQKKNGFSFPVSGNNSTSRDKNTGTQNEALWARQCSAATEIYEEAAGVDVADDNQVTLDGNEKLPTSDNLSEGYESSAFAGNLNGDQGVEVKQADKHVKQRSLSKVSLPQWTDEQLLELFNDDDPLF